VRKYKKGDEVEAVVLGIDVEKERISLGIKQLEGDPFSNFVAINDKGAIVDGVVKSVDPKGAVVTLSGEVEGYLRASEIAQDRVEDARNEQQEAMRSLQGDSNAAATGTTNLGALLKAKLDGQNS
jgi:small subunit ribosomal protein S1